MSQKKKNMVEQAVEKVTDIVTGKEKAKQELIEIKARLFDIRTAKEQLSAQYNKLTETERVLVNEANKRIDIIEGKKSNVEKAPQAPKQNCFE